MLLDSGRFCDVFVGRCGTDVMHRTVQVSVFMHWYATHKKKRDLKVRSGSLVIEFLCKSSESEYQGHGLNTYSKFRHGAAPLASQ